MKERSKQLVFWLLWIFATAAGWAGVEYMGFSLRATVLRSATQIPSLALELLLNGALLGSVVGLLQWLVLRFWKKAKGWWIPITVAGYAVGSPIGFILTTSLNVFAARRAGLQLFVEGSNVSLSWPLPVMMLVTGLILAAVQWPVLRRLIPFAKAKEAILWGLGTMLGWGLGFWAASYTLSFGLSLFAQNVAAGSLIGIVTGMMLTLLFSQPITPLNFKTAYIPQKS